MNLGVMDLNVIKFVVLEAVGMTFKIQSNFYSYLTFPFLSKSSPF